MPCEKCEGNGCTECAANEQQAIALSVLNARLQLNASWNALRVVLKAQKEAAPQATQHATESAILALEAAMSSCRCATRALGSDR